MKKIIAGLHFLVLMGSFSLSAHADVTFNQAKVINAYPLEFRDFAVREPLVFKKYISNTGTTKYYISKGVIVWKDSNPGFTEPWQMWETILTMGHCDLDPISQEVNFVAEGIPVHVRQNFPGGGFREFDISNVRFNASLDPRTGITSSFFVQFPQVINKPGVNDRQSTNYLLNVGGVGALTAPVGNPQTPKPSPTPAGSANPAPTAAPVKK